MHLSENTKSNRSLWQNKEYSWLIPHCKPETKETTSWTMVGQAKDIVSSPNHFWKLYVEVVIESEARPAVVQLTSEA